MKFTNHAHQRCQERTISPDELELINSFGIVIEQKGGTAIITIAKAEVTRWSIALKELQTVLKAIKTDIEGHHYIKRKIRAVKRLLSRLQSNVLPYFVISLEDDLVITCGHRNKKLKHNY